MVTWSPVWIGRVTSTSSPDVARSRSTWAVDLLVGHLEGRQGHDQAAVAGDGRPRAGPATTASNDTGPDSSPAVMSMSGWSIGSTSVSSTARE